MDPLERVLRPIVEGQLRGFLKEHPEVLTAVTWYKGKTADPTVTFVGSVAKRIIRDLLSPTTRAKLAAALLEVRAGAPPSDLPEEVGPGNPSGTRAPGVATVAAPGDPRVLIHEE